MRRVKALAALAVVAVAVLIGAGIARAGEIFGTLSQNNKPVAAGTKVEVVIQGKTYAGETDKFGGFRIVAKEKGKGSLRATLKGQTAACDIVSFDKSTRYDLILEEKDGALSMRRK